VEFFGGWQLGANSSSTAEIALQGGPVEPATLRTAVGSATMAGGSLEVSGLGQVQGAAILNGVTTNVHANSRLTFEGPTVLRGGTHQGPGTLQFEGTTTVDQPTLLETHVVNLDGGGAGIIQLQDAELQLNVDQIDLFDNQFDGELHLTGPQASLHVELLDPAASWQMDGTIVASGTVGGAQNVLQGSDVLLTGTMNATAITQISAAIDLTGTLHTDNLFDAVRLSSDRNVIRSTANVTGPGRVHIDVGGALQVEDSTNMEMGVVNRGRFEPGTAIGTVSIGSNFTQFASGVLEMELAGPPAGDHDRLDLTGPALLDGTLEVSSINKFVPSPGAIYTLVNASNVSGTFDSVSFTSDSIVNFTGTVMYPGNQVQLLITDVSLLGDFDGDLTLDCTDVDSLVATIAAGGADPMFDLNGDALVDANDLNVWLTEAGTFNIGAPYLAGDGTLDGFVDGSDYGVWNSHKFTMASGWCGGDFNADGVTDGSDFNIWNAHKFSVSGASASASVPEPNGWIALLAIAGIKGLRSRRSMATDRAHADGTWQHLA
jgi:hypothetical protein